MKGVINELSENSFQEKIDALVAGELPEIIIEQPDFMAFREIWASHPQRKEIVGEAGLNGRIKYKFIKEAPKTENKD